MNEQHEVVPPRDLTPSQLYLDELLSNPPCKCRESCLVSLINDSVKQSSLVILMDEFKTLRMKDRPNFFVPYQQDYDSVQPYIFELEEITIPLCFVSTASVFKLTREKQKLCFISPSGRQELCRQRLNSDLMSATAKFLRSAPASTSMFQPWIKINWNHEAFSQFGPKSEKFGKHMRIHGIHPWNGDLLYAVKNQFVLPGLVPPTKYEQLLSELGGCQVTLTESQQSILQRLAILAPAQAKSAKWVKVATISLQNRKESQLHYISLKSNTLMGTYIAHLRQSCKPMEWEKWKPIIDEITVSCHFAIGLVARHTKSLDYILTSILYSPFHGLQNPHYDFKKEVLDKNGDNMYLGFTPLTEDGMFLQVWTKEGNGTVLYIPLGVVVILPSKTMHAGGFCSRAITGNLRLHFYFYLNAVPAESHNTNVYSDELGHFSERYHNAVGLGGVKEGDGTSALDMVVDCGRLPKLFAK